MRKSKPDRNIIVSLNGDMNMVLKDLYPDEVTRPNVASIDYIGLAGMGLIDFCHPVKV